MAPVAESRQVGCSALKCQQLVQAGEVDTAIGNLYRHRKPPPAPALPFPLTLVSGPARYGADAGAFADRTFAVPPPHIPGSPDPARLHTPEQVAILSRKSQHAL